MPVNIDEFIFAPHTPDRQESAALFRSCSLCTLYNIIRSYCAHTGTLRMTTTGPFTIREQ